jgi:anti-anti-sigma regulatory factor
MQASSWEVTFVRVECGVEAETAHRVRSYAPSLLSRPGHVILDIRDASLDSAGLCAVLSLTQRLELQGRRLLVVATDPHLFGLVERAGVGGAFPLFRDTEEAVSYARDHCPLALAA